MADNPFAGGGAGGGPTADNPFARGTAATKRSGGGILDTLKHVATQTPSDLYHAAVNIPAGVYQLGKTEVLADKYAVQHPSSIIHNSPNPYIAQEQGLLKGLAQQTATSFEHPLRNPGYTALNALPVAAGAARAAEVAGIVKAVPRTVSVNDLTVSLPSSRSALGRLGQKATDTATARSERLSARKIGKAVTAQGRTREAMHRGPAAALAKMGKKLSPGEQKALQVVAEQAPLDRRIVAASARVIGAKDPLARARHQTELDLLHQAKALLTTRSGRPAFAKEAQHLVPVYRQMVKVAGGREQLAQGLGLLTEEAGARRKAAAAQVAIGETPGEGGFQPTAEAVRVPDVARNAPRGLARSGKTGVQRVVGKPKVPGSLTHTYTGALREQALRRQDTTRLVAESSMELARFASLQHVVDLAKRAATSEPTRPTDLAIRLDKIGAGERLPLDVRRYVDDPEGFLASASTTEKARLLDKIRARLILGRPDQMDPEQAAAFQKLKDAGKVGFVPREVLGDYAKAQAPLSAVTGGRFVRAVDAINNASRLAILYLKPAYAAPNLLGNVAMNLIQQGFAAPRNLARAARLNAALGPEDTALLDSHIGEGVAASASAHGQGALSRVVDRMAHLWSGAVDKYPRRAAFLYEAQRAGFRTPERLRALLTDPAQKTTLIRVSLEANREIVDYGSLTPVEREIVRRVVFFYPWVKGATVYTGRVLREHPAKFGALGVVGVQGRTYSEAAFPQTPSYLEGLIPYGGSQAINPAAAQIAGTPAQVGLTLAGLVTGRIPQAGEASQFITPAVNLALAELLRKNYSSGYTYPGGTTGLQVARDALISQLPQAALITNLEQATSGGGQGRLYPPTVQSALLQFLVGGLAPRPVNRQRLAALAAKEKTQMKRGG